MYVRPAHTLLIDQRALVLELGVGPGPVVDPPVLIVRFVDLDHEFIDGRWLGRTAGSGRE
jgi:hypothetical protein